MLAGLSFAAEIGIGDPREDVLRQLGKPTSMARRGDHEIFLYAQGGRVEMREGRVVDVKGTFPAHANGSPSPAENAPAPLESASARKSAGPLPAEAADPEPASAANPIYEYNPAVAANELAKHVEKMDTAWGMAPKAEGLHSPLESIPTFLTGLLLRFGITIAALKLAFKYWEMDAFWTGILMIAAIDMILHAVLELLGPASGGLTTVMALEYGIPGLAMIYTVHRFCFNKRVQNAVLTAGAVKLVVTMIYLFAGVAALNLIYS